MSSDRFIQAIKQAEAPRPFVFLWVARRGPTIKRFADVHAFTGYVRGVRDMMGSDSVDFRTPSLAVAVTL